jgi:4-hydroxybenzoate polyprenyltransferase
MVTIALAAVTVAVVTTAAAVVTVVVVTMAAAVVTIAVVMAAAIIVAAVAVTSVSEQIVEDMIERKTKRRKNRIEIHTLYICISRGKKTIVKKVYLLENNNCKKEIFTCTMLSEIDKLFVKDV